MINKLVAESVLNGYYLEIYKLVSEVKTHLAQHHITPETILTPEQAYAVMRLEQKLLGIKIKLIPLQIEINVMAACHEPHIIEALKACETALQQIETPETQAIFKHAVDILRAYKPASTKSMSYDGPIRLRPSEYFPTLNHELEAGKPTPLNQTDIGKETLLEGRIKWQKRRAIYQTEAEAKKREANHHHKLIKDRDDYIRDEIKQHIAQQVDEQLKILALKYNALMSWYTLLQTAYGQADTSLKAIFREMDIVANRLEDIAKGLTKGLVAFSLSPIGLNNFIDPGMKIFTSILDKFNVSKGTVELDADEKGFIYSTTRLNTSADHNEYFNLIKGISEENFYDQIDKVRRFLANSQRSHSALKLAESMALNNGDIWKNYTQEEVIAGVRDYVIDSKDYHHGTLPTDPSYRLSVTNDINDIFSKSIHQAFEPIQNQFGTIKESSVLEDLISNIAFDPNIAGPDAHRKGNEKYLVNRLSNQIEIYMIVKFLVEDKHYFGRPSVNRFYRELNPEAPNDFKMGLHADDDCTLKLTKVLLEKIAKTNNEELKKALGLDVIEPELSKDQTTGKLAKIKAWFKPTPHNQKVINHHPLLEMKWHSPSFYHFRRFLSFFSCGRIEHTKTEAHLKRETMIKAIRKAYYGQDISTILKHEIVDIAPTLMTKPASGMHDREEALHMPKWKSEIQLKAECEAAVQPLRQMTQYEADKKAALIPACETYTERAMLLSGVKQKLKLEAIRESTPKTPTKKARMSPDAS